MRGGLFDRADSGRAVHQPAHGGTHIENTLLKLGVSSRTAAVSLALAETADTTHPAASYPTAPVPVAGVAGGRHWRRRGPHPPNSPA